MTEINERLLAQYDARWDDEPPVTVPSLGAWAKCPECGSCALDWESLTVVSCRHCGAWSRA